MNIMEILTGPTGTTLGWTLIHLLWQATAVALILGAVRTLWTSASSNARYATAIVALATILVLPFLTFAHLWEEQVILTAMNETIEPVPEAEASWSMAPGSTEATTSAMSSESLISTSLPWLVGIWMLGVALLATRLVVRTAWTSRLTRERVIEVEGSWHRVLDRLRRKLEIGQKVEIFESSLIEVPTVVGWLRPVILVPTSVFTGLTYRQIETILAHELAHVRRLDALVNFLQSVVETLFFYHPAVWWISGRIRIEREHCCDDIAIAVCGDRVAYARALTFLEEMRSTVPAGAVAATGGSLLERIKRIAGVEERDRKAPSLAALIVLLMLGSATVWALSAPDENHDADMKVQVGESGWWFVSPPAPPSPPADPAAPEAPAPPRSPIFAGIGSPSMPPAPPAPEPPVAPEPPAVPYFGFDPDVLAPALASLDEALSRMEVPLPQIPSAGLPLADLPVIAAVAPDVPPAPSVPAAPRIARVAPRADHHEKVHAERPANDRKISDDLSVDDLIRLRAVGVTAEYLKALRSMGYTDLTIGEVMSLRGVGVTPEYIRAMRTEFGKELSTSDLTRLRGVGVTPEWIGSIESFAGKQLTVSDAIRLRGVGVTPEWIGTMSRALGESLTIEDTVRLRGVGVSIDYIRELETRGIQVPPSDDLVRLRGVGVTPEYIDEMRSLGFGELDIDNLVRLRGVGVTPAWVAEMKKAGLSNLDLDTLVRLRGVGVTPDYVNDLREAGLSTTNVSDLVRLRASGVTPDYIRELRDAGLENLTIDKLIRLRSAGVDADYVREMKN